MASYAKWNVVEAFPFQLYCKWLKNKLFLRKNVTHTFLSCLSSDPTSQEPHQSSLF